MVKGDKRTVYQYLVHLRGLSACKRSAPNDPPSCSDPLDHGQWSVVMETDRVGGKRRRFPNNVKLVFAEDRGRNIKD